MKISPSRLAPRSSARRVLLAITIVLCSASAAVAQNWTRFGTQDFPGRVKAISWGQGRVLDASRTVAVGQWRLSFDGGAPVARDYQCAFNPDPSYRGEYCWFFVTGLTATNAVEGRKDVHLFLQRRAWASPNCEVTLPPVPPGEPPRGRVRASPDGSSRPHLFDLRTYIERVLAPELGDVTADTPLFWSRWPGRKGVRRAMPIHGKNIWRLCKTYGRMIGVSELKPHDLRHGVAMEVLDQQHDLGQVRALLGQKRIDTTQIYATIRPAQLKRAVAFSLAPRIGTPSKRSCDDAATDGIAPSSHSWHMEGFAGARSSRLTLATSTLDSDFEESEARAVGTRPFPCLSPRGRS